ncbi:hypothetical protein GW17_00057307 [Ensete ventricosum]|nr:hypothetical protein GW17_00057307 [Ensete ventricosum]
MSIRKQLGSSLKVGQVSDVRPKMLLLRCASRDGLVRRLPRGLARRPSRGRGLRVTTPTIKSVPPPRWSKYLKCRESFCERVPPVPYPGVTFILAH